MKILNKMDEKHCFKMKKKKSSYITDDIIVRVKSSNNEKEKIHVIK